MTENDDQEEVVENATNMSTIQKYLLMVLIAIANISCGINTSLLAPFYPKVAEEKGATPSQYGFVFGITPLAAFFAAPCFGRFGCRIGVKNIYICGSLIQGIVIVCLGSLTDISTLSTFLALSYILRLIDGIALAAAYGSIVTLLIVMFPNQTGIAVALNEATFGFGLTFGPLFGTVLYGLGGFTVPFMAGGILATIIAVLLYFILPTVDQKSPSSDKCTDKLTIKGVIKSPAIFLPLLDNLALGCSMRFMEGMLEPYMRNELMATLYQVGYAFLLNGLAYATSSLPAGMVIDKIKYPWVVSVTGKALCAFGYLLVAPIPFMKFNPTTKLCYFGMTLAGVGPSLLLVTTAVRSQRAAISKGYQNGLSTYHLISGLCTSSWFLGLFLGPTIGGFLVEHYGFPQSAFMYTIFFVFTAFLDITGVTCKTCNHPKGYEQVKE